MLQKIFILLLGIVSGLLLGTFIVTKTNIVNIGTNNNTSIKDVFKTPKRNVIGFLPFWLINKAKDDYSPYITQLSYFNLTIDGDGSIQKYTSPGESDPGYHALSTGKVNGYLQNAKNKGIDISLTIFSGKDKTIDKFLENPTESAQNLIDDIAPIISEHGFSDINLDIERVGDSTPNLRKRYIQFVSEVRRLLDPTITITLDASGTAFVKDTNLVNPGELAKIVDFIVLMGYDFHNPGSFVTGPVAPQEGAGIVSEYDIESAVQAALIQVPANKLILAMPLYGYSWESINPIPRSATLPGSAYSMSSRSVEELLSECSTCSAQFEKTDKENYIVYKNDETSMYHQIFYPDQKSTQIKVDFAKAKNLGGVALWALGYEDSTILEPLSSYRR